MKIRKVQLKNGYKRFHDLIIDPGYNNFVTNIYDQNLKDSTNRIRNICGITTRIDPERLKLTLPEFVTEEMNVYSELEECIFKRRQNK